MLFVYHGGWHYWIAALLCLTLALLWSGWRAPWRQLLSAPARQHAFALTVLGLALMWQLKVVVEAQFVLHPLLMMWVVVVFGPPLALWAGTLAFVLSALLNGELGWWSSVPLLTTVLVPVVTGALVLQLIDCLRWRNLFVFMLGGGFFGAMVTVQAMALVQWLYIFLLGPEPLLVIASDYYYLTLLMMFPEGFINGAIVTTLTVLAPDLVKTFNDREYLQ